MGGEGRLQPVYLPSKAVPEDLVGVDPRGGAPLQDVIIVPLPSERLLQIPSLL